MNPQLNLAYAQARQTELLDEAAAALVFAQALPSGLELGMDHSMSYARWLRGWPVAGRGSRT